MNNQLTKAETMPSQYTQEQILLLKNTICKGVTDNDFMIFSHICKRTGLDPFARQIYAVARKGVMTIQTGIDGYRLIAERTGKYAPGKEPSYIYDSNGKLLSSTAYIKKQTQDGTWHEVCATAFFSEYVQVFNGQPSQFWSKMPHGQLAKCAEALALRKAFPQEMSGIYTNDEMAQADGDLEQNNKKSSQNIEDKSNANQSENLTTIELISPQQANDFRVIISKCSPEFKKWLSDLLQRENIKNINDVSTVFYNGIIPQALKDMKNYQASIAKEEPVAI